VVAFHEDAEGERGAEVELAGEELEEDSGEEDSVEGEEGFEGGAGLIEEEPEEQGKEDGDKGGLGAGEEEE
jgi:hypothetical protein